MDAKKLKEFTVQVVYGHILIHNCNYDENAGYFSVVFKF